MSRIYTSAADHFNYHPYMLLVHPHYNPGLPAAIATGEIEPIYQTITPQHPVRSMYAIKYMVDMHSTQHAFRVVEDIDVIRIFHAIDAYLFEVKDSIPINPAIRAYVEKILGLRQQSFINFARMLNRRPEWREAYSQGSERLLKLFELFSSPNNTRRKLMDPIEALRDPPVTLTRNNPDTAGVKLPVTQQDQRSLYYNA